MDFGELTFRLILEITVIAFLWVVLSHFVDSEVSLLIATIIVHTFNWIFNGLFWALVIFAFPNLKNPGAENTVAYLNSLRSRLLKSSSIVAVAVYGSVVRGKWHERSDIDIRFVRKPGLKSLIDAVSITMRERFLAFLFKQPMDLFLADNIDFLKKMRSDERPLLLFCSEVAVSEFYPESEIRELTVNDLISGDGK